LALSVLVPLRANAEPVESAQPQGTPRHGAGTLELRIQTATELPIGGQLAFAAAPGIAYNPEAEEYYVNVVGGAGYFLTPALALGLDASFTRFAEADTRFSVTPFVKLVSNLPSWRLGAFVELSPGVVVESIGGKGASYVQLSLWGGAHVPLTDSAALVLGPTITGLIRTDQPGPNDLVIGDRIGLNVYLPPELPPLAERPRLGRGTFELRFQTGTHAVTGNVLSPQASQSALYSVRQKVLFANVIGGGGVFLTDAFAFGGELSNTIAFEPDSKESAQLVGVAGFVKVVSGMAAWGPGGFAELSPGLLAAVVQDGQRAERGVLSQVSLWAGAHLPFGTSTAFAVGPSLTRFDDLEGSNDGLFIVGARLGLSLYMPSKRKPR
jgi:hypothetical protein